MTEKKIVAVRTKPTTLDVDVDGVIFTGATITPTKRAELEKKATKYEKGKPVYSQNVFLFNLFDARVVGWSDNLVDEDRVPIPCTTESKFALWENDQDFAGRILNEINRAFDSREDLAEKNSEAGVSGN